MERSTIAATGTGPYLATSYHGYQLRHNRSDTVWIPDQRDRNLPWPTTRGEFLIVSTKLEGVDVGCLGREEVNTVADDSSNRDGGLM